MFEVCPYLTDPATERAANWHAYRPTELDSCDVNTNPFAILGR
jgi:hypothetical protein